MRAKDFLIVESFGDLFEVKMSPSSLKKLASQIDARVGIEFEMIVPDVGSVDDYEGEQEPDYDMDERTEDIDDIVRFFNDGDYNYGSTLRTFEEQLREKYSEWVNEKAYELWEENKLEQVYDFIKENYDEDDIADELEIEPDLFGKRQITKDMIKAFAVEQIETEGSYYDEARDAYISDVQDDPVSYDLEESNWLQEAGMRYMSDVESVFAGDIVWPHWRGSGDGDGELNLSNLADDFSEVIDRPVHYSTGYHGGPRTSDGYTIEPDSSLSGSGDDAGLEFISPPLPIDEALADVHKIKKWADKKGIYTNRSTGLHMNVSVPGFNPEDLDFVKLTLLLGDKYLLERFGRSANTYCKSAMDVISEAPSVQDKELLFKKLKSNLETIASRVIHSGRVGKFTSINPKENRVEFRGPGGDWLGENFEKIEDTLYRCVVALDAAVDPAKYRKDYLKKLTKMFAPTKGSLEDVFVQYAAGTITRQELKNKIKAAQSSRRQEKLSKEGVVELEFYDAKDGDWIIEYDNPTGESRRIFLKKTEQVSDDNKAMVAAMKLEPSWFKPDDIENIIVTEFSGRKDYAVLDNEGNLINTYMALTPLQAIDIALSYDGNLSKDKLTVKLANEYQPTASPATSSTTQREPGTEYNLYRVRGNGDSQYISARSVGEAGRTALILYPNLGTTFDSLDIVMQDADPNVTAMYLRSQQSELDRMNQPSSGGGLSSGRPNEGESYIVSDPGDNAGGVRFRANSPEHAIERARAAFNIPADRELVARLENG